MKYIDILVNLDKEAIKMYKKWLDFSFSKKSKHLKCLVLFMLNENEKHNGKLDVYYAFEESKKDNKKEKINKEELRLAAWNVMYPQEGEHSRKYNERDLDREVSKITKNLEDFLYYYYSKEKEVKKNMLLVQKYSDWGLDEWSAQLIQDTDTILSEYHYKDALTLGGYKLQYQLIFLKNQTPEELYLQQYMNFMADWISQAMYQICTMSIKQLNEVKKEELPLFPKEIVLQWIETKHEIVQKKDIQLFYKVYMVYQDFFEKKGKMEDIEELMSFILEFKAYPKPDRIKNMFRTLLHAVNLIEDRKIKLTFLWDLYTLGIKSELILVNGLILPQDWLNINKIKIFLKISEEQWEKEVGDLPESKKTLEIYTRLLAKVNEVETFFQQGNFQKVIKIYKTEANYEKIYDDYHKFQIRIYYFLAKYLILDKSIENYHETVQHFKHELVLSGKQIKSKLPLAQQTKFLNTLNVLILLIQKKHNLSRRKQNTEIEQTLANYFEENAFEMYEKEFLAKQIT